MDLLVTSCSSLSPFPRDHCYALLLTGLREKCVWVKALKTIAIAVKLILRIVCYRKALICFW